MQSSILVWTLLSTAWSCKHSLTWTSITEWVHWCKCLFLNPYWIMKEGGAGVEKSRDCSVPCRIKPQEYLLGEGLASCPSWKDRTATDSHCVLPLLCSEKRKNVSVCSVKSGKEVSAGHCPFLAVLHSYMLWWGCTQAVTTNVWSPFREIIRWLAIK